ncbi:TIGR03619 family F420-dependent LLM class oxidoreductase [Mycolicibacterium wolinskyi]|uniref:TIGR03619 family F420-dependent LLM class oxidoreductase n=1 Tax=Mycolicibacterium wolinskyi TaxID=59750 RepID=UPI000835BE30|nr:TIGR03619 family F420-dependent LLM class oxidoreductase [Mycolicibacterium wolinskyi]
MKFGLALANKGHGAGPESLDAGGSAAERFGWDSVWVTDHLFVPNGPEAAEYGSMLEALTALTYVAARHQRVRIGTSVVVPAMRDAPLLAKELATIDVLSGGRLVVGIGVSDKGDLPEYTNLGKAERFGRRGAYLDEAVALWRHLWSGRTDRFEGEFHTLSDYVFQPLPAQGAAIPVWCGGRSERALRRTAELADGYHAAQTGPADLAARVPRLAELTTRLGRRMPTLSVRARVEFGPSTRSVYTLHGTEQDMLAEVEAFARAGADELILVFDAVRPDDVTQAVQRFHRSVVEPFRERAVAGARSS